MGAKLSGMPDFSRLKSLNGEVSKAMQDTVEFAKEAIVDVVETSGTDRQWGSSWYGRSGSGRGRVNTGEMRDKVRGEVGGSDNVVTGEAGWFSDAPDYTRLQNGGFTHYLTGEKIEGMHAISSVRDEVYQEFGSNMLEALRRATR